MINLKECAENILNDIQMVSHDFAVEGIAELAEEYAEQEVLKFKKTIYKENQLLRNSFNELQKQHNKLKLQI